MSPCFFSLIDWAPSFFILPFDCIQTLLVKCHLDLLFSGNEATSSLGEANSVENDWRQKLFAMAEAGQRTDLILVSCAIHGLYLA